MTDNVEHADNVERAAHADNVEHADHADHVTTAGNVIVRALQPSRAVRILFALSVFLAVATLAVSVLFQSPTTARLASSVERLTEGEQIAVRERAVLADELASFDADVRCAALYNNDVDTGKALSQIALSDLFAAAVSRDPDLPEVERVADNRRLVEQLEAANEPLRAAVAALERYKALDPQPATCPHPDARTNPPVD